MGGTDIDQIPPTEETPERNEEQESNGAVGSNIVVVDGNIDCRDAVPPDGTAAGPFPVLKLVLVR